MKHKKELKNPELEKVAGGNTESNERAEKVPPDSDTDTRAPGDISTSGESVPNFVIQYKRKY